VTSSPPAAPPVDVAEHLVTTAGRLFARRGFAAVGVGPIVKASGVGKATLYRHYPAKTDLIVAWLKREDAAFTARAAAWEAAADPAPLEQLRGFFRGLAAWVGSPECLGCPFQLAVAEFPDEESAPHRVAATHKAALLFRFRRLCRAAGLGEPESVAQQLLLVTDGALAAARTFPGRNPGRDVARAADAVLGRR
jgi:AcrR family transcriptional regulator